MAVVTPEVVRGLISASALGPFAPLIARRAQVELDVLGRNPSQAMIADALEAWGDLGRSYAGRIRIDGATIPPANLPGAFASVVIDGCAAELLKASKRKPAFSRANFDKLFALELRLPEWRVLHHIAWAAWGDAWADEVVIPGGKSLQLAARAGAKSSHADQAVERLQQAGLFIAHRRRPNHGQSSTWVLSPGSLWPSFHKGALVPWPDVLPPVDWVGPRSRAKAVEAGLRMMVAWRDAAGREHGTRWATSPGVGLTGAAWADIGGTLNRSAALTAWREAGWVESRRGGVAPGATLSMAQAMLNEASQAVQKRNAPRARSKKRAAR